MLKHRFISIAENLLSTLLKTIILEFFRLWRKKMVMSAIKHKICFKK